MTRFSHIGLLALVAVMSFGCAAGTGVPVAEDAVEMEDVRTSQERWLLFPSGDRFNFVQTINSRYLWMIGGLWCGQIQQYDMKEQKMTVFTERDGLPLSTRGVERLIASEDGRCLLMVDRSPILYVWQEGVGWRSLPAVGEEYELKDVAFDTDGSIIVLTTEKVALSRQKTCTILRLVRGEWRELKTTELPTVSAIIPFHAAYVIKGYDGQSKLYRIGKAPDAEPVEIAGQLLDENRLKYFRVAGRTYMARPDRIEQEVLPRYPGIRAMQTLREITPDGVVLTSYDSPQYLDLRSRSFQPMSMVIEPEGKVICEIPSVTKWEVNTRNGASIFPIMDINGEVWLSGRTYRKDGQWVPTAGSRHELSGIRAAQTDEAYYDTDEDRWRLLVPPEYGSFFSVVDPDKKLAWVISSYKAPTMRLMDFSTDEPRVIQEVPRQDSWGLPSFQDAQGRWWMWRWNVISLDPDGRVKRYPLNQPSSIWLSPKTGDVWASNNSGFFKLDPEKDQFVLDQRDALYDAYSFRLGRTEYSILPLKHGLGMSSFMRKVDGKWKEAGISATRMGDRMLINAKNGVWEYDAREERWVKLHDRVAFHVAFDSQNRRILANHHGILLYDGDPFEDPEYAKYRKLIEAQETVLTESVRFLASQDERVRQFAILQIQNLSPLVTPRIEALIENDQTPDETRTILRKSLEVITKEKLPPGLFQIAHPPCPPYEP